MASALEGARQIACLISRNRLGNQAHDEIACGQFRQNLPEAFAHASLDAVAVHRTRKQAFGNHHPQPRVAHLVRARHHHHVIRSSALIVGKHPVEIGFVDQARVAEAHATRFVWVRVD